MDDFDLYNDLDEFQAQQDKKSKEVQSLEEKLAAAEQNVEQLKLEKKQLGKKLKTIEINFQNLLDTAKAEIRRKDQLIAQLRQEKDDICFRRQKVAPTNRWRAENNSTHMDNCNQQVQYAKNVAKEISKETRSCVERLIDSAAPEAEINSERESRHKRELSKEREQYNNKARNRSREREKSRERGTRSTRERSRERNRSNGTRDKSRDWRRDRDKEYLNENKHRSKIDYERKPSRDPKQQRDAEVEEKRYRGSKRERSRERQSAMEAKRSKTVEKYVEDAYSSCSRKKENASSITLEDYKQRRNNEHLKNEENNKNCVQIEENKVENCKNSKVENLAEKDTTMGKTENNMPDVDAEQKSMNKTKNSPTLEMEKETNLEQTTSKLDIEQSNAFVDYLEIFAETDISDAESPANTPMKSLKPKAAIIQQVFDIIESDEEFEFCEQSPSNVAAQAQISNEHYTKDIENTETKAQYEDKSLKKKELEVECVTEKTVSDNKSEETADCAVEELVLTTMPCCTVEDSLGKVSDEFTINPALMKSGDNNSTRENFKTKAMCKNYESTLNIQSEILMTENGSNHSSETNTEAADITEAIKDNPQVTASTSIETAENVKELIDDNFEISITIENNEKAAEMPSTLANEINIEEETTAENHKTNNVEILAQTAFTAKETTNWGTFKIPKKLKSLNKSIETVTVAETDIEKCVNATNNIKEINNEAAIISIDKTNNSLIEEIFDKSNEESIVIACSPKAIDREIDSCMSLMFESPQRNTSINAIKTTPTILENITINEIQNTTTNESTLSSSAETKHLVMGSTDYVFEKVSDNVVNLFITRRKRKRRKVAEPVTKSITTPDAAIKS